MKVEVSMKDTNDPQSVPILDLNDERQGWTSASNAQADLLCPGRHNACKGITQSSGEYAEFGRRIHAALAKQSDEGLEPQEEKVYDLIRKIERNRLEEFFGVDHRRVTTFREERWWIRFPHPDPESGVEPLLHSGRLDVLHRFGLRGLILEYKTLPGDVPDSPSNLQLRDQAVLAVDNVVLNEVGVCVVQPLVTMTPDVCTYDKAALTRSLEELEARVRASNSPSSKRVAGELQCKYCPARYTCAAHAAWQASLLPAVSITDTPVARWSSEQMAVFLDRRSAAKKWLEECEGYIKKLLRESPDAVPGWRLAEDGQTSFINDPQELFTRLCGLIHDNEENRAMLMSSFMGCLTVSQEKLEKLVRSLTGLKGKAADEKLSSLTEGILSHRTRAGSLARIKP